MNEKGIRFYVGINAVFYGGVCVDKEWEMGVGGMGMSELLPRLSLFKLGQLRPRPAPVIIIIVWPRGNITSCHAPHPSSWRSLAPGTDPAPAGVIYFAGDSARWQLTGGPGANYPKLLNYTKLVMYENDRGNVFEYVFSLNRALQIIS